MRLWSAPTTAPPGISGPELAGMRLLSTRRPSTAALRLVACVLAANAVDPAGSLAAAVGAAVLQWS
jgi:hypothetical protein